MGDMLLTAKQVADQLQVSSRKVKYLPIPIVRLGRNRRYDPRDVARYIEACKCISINEPRARIGGRNSQSKGLGLDEALKLHPEEMPKQLLGASETKLLQLPRQSPRGVRSKSLRLIKPVGGTGSNTAGG